MKKIILLMMFALVLISSATAVNVNTTLTNQTFIDNFDSGVATDNGWTDAGQAGTPTETGGYYHSNGADNAMMYQTFTNFSMFGEDWRIEHWMQYATDVTGMIIDTDNNFGGNYIELLDLANAPNNLIVCFGTCSCTGLGSLFSPQTGVDYNYTAIFNNSDKSFNLWVNDTYMGNSGTISGCTPTTFLIRARKSTSMTRNVTIWTHEDYTPSATPLTTTLNYPTKGSTFYGTFNGTISINLTNVNGSGAYCDINDTSYTLQDTPPHGNETISWQNNTRIQNGNRTYLINCTDVSGQQSNISLWFYIDSVLNISIYDEETDNWTKVNVSVDLISDTYALNLSGDNNYSIQSLTPGNYTINYVAPGYDARTYYLTVLGSQKSHVILYLLNSSVSTLVIPTVIDTYSNPVANVTIKMQRHYINTNSYKTVSMTRTNKEGEGILYLDIYDVPYKFLFQLDGSIVGIESPNPVTRTDPTYTVNLEEDQFLSWRQYDNVITNVTFVNQSGIIYARFIFNDINNNLRQACLKVTRHATTDSSIICNNCTASNSGSLSCVINTSLPGSYQADGLIDTDTEGSWYNVGLSNYIVILASSIYDFGEEGMFNALMILGTITLMSLATITGSFVMLIIGFIAVGLLSLVSGFTVGLVMFGVVTLFTILFIGRRSMNA